MPLTLLRAPTSIALLALLTFSHSAGAQDVEAEQMGDYGKTLARVEHARLVGDYQRAVDELSGYLQRWSDRGFFDARDTQQIRERMRRYVELREALELATTDKGAASKFLQMVVRHTDPSARTVEQVRALAILANHNPALKASLDATFPARLVVSVKTPGDEPPDHSEILLSNAMVDLTRNQPLRLLDQEGQGSMSVVVTMTENPSGDLLRNTMMKSFAVHAVVEVVDAMGVPVVRSATTTAILGINPGNAATSGMRRVADRVYASVIDELALSIDRGQ